MPDVTRTTGLTSTLDASSGSVAPQIPDYLAGENIETGQPVYLNADGMLYRASGAAADAAANILGFAGKTVRAGLPLTVFGPGTRFGGFSGLTPGALLYASATVGELSDAATVGGTRPIARAVTATDIIVIGWY
jgi:hypothetical protein